MENTTFPSIRGWKSVLWKQYFPKNRLIVNTQVLFFFNILIRM